MILIIAEKAIAGRRIAGILAGERHSEKASAGAIHFDFGQKGQQYSVVPLRGHIVDVDFPAKYMQWLGTDLRKLAESEIEYIETEKTIAALLKRIAPSVEQVIVATDDDREGESIGLEAVEILHRVNKKIPVKRMRFSAIIEQEIKPAFAALQLLDRNLAESANARREIDLVWGAVLTRFLSLISGQLGKQFLSMGRVQGPVLALIVDREKERMAFQSKKYWIVQALFEKDKQQFIALHKKGRFWEKQEAEKAAQCKKAKEGTVQQVKKTKKVLSRPVPFNTTLFLRAATAIGFSAGRAMQIAETLYQQGLTSYPRTDNSVYPAALDLRAILSQLATVQQFAPLAGQLLKQKKLEASRGAFAKDHPPIHPVAAAPAGRLGSDEWRIYELICRRFMATLAANALTENLAVEIELAKELFVANGQRYLSKGWKIFYPYSKAEETILPVLQKGDEVLLVKLDMLEKETMPPPRYSQGALIKEMSDLGLGTKATRAEIIQKLYARKYIVGQKAIEPNKIAFAVIDSLEKYDGVVVKPKMTADLEKEMDTVAEGKKEKKAVVDESRQFLSNALQQLLLNKNEIGSMLRAALRADAIIGKCTKPECDGELLIRHGRTGKRFLGCSAYPKCTNTFPLPQRGSITVLQKRCDACGNFMVQVGGRRYRFSMCIDPNCKSKDEWKKKREEKIRAQEEKEATEKGAEKKVAEEGDGKIKELKALPKKKKAKGSKLKETGQGTEKKKKSKNLKPRAQANEKEEEGA